MESRTSYFKRYQLFHFVKSSGHTFRLNEYLMKAVNLFLKTEIKKSKEGPILMPNGMSNHPTYFVYKIQ